MSQVILSHLQANDGATIDELCAVTGLNVEGVRHILQGLANSAFVIGVARYNRTPKFYAVTSQGHCEWCGLYEHRLVAAMCARCLDKTSGLESLTEPALPASQTSTERSQA